MKERVTIEDLIEYSKYSIGTLYDLTHYGIISSPVRGIDPEQRGSKGSYPASVFDEIDRYKELKLEGFKKAEIIAMFKGEASNVQIHQG